MNKTNVIRFFSYFVFYIFLGFVLVGFSACLKLKVFGKILPQMTKI